MTEFQSSSGGVRPCEKIKTPSKEIWKKHSMAPRKTSAKSKSNKSEQQLPKRKSLFDHVKAIRQEKDPNYLNNLSEDDRKSFNHLMIVRALSMDAAIVEEMAQLYQLFDKIPRSEERV